ncbi:Fatty acyl-CoA reductase 3 [Citrus sinensis]|uniref:Fatty acyl-CoA reductase 3 n=1 Tax=Citrus sinensis TaxID=2711 RepID=A0ACB8IRZ0_CITSI|nr:Fatty acyl-CoA reductase 3 [Citrus sinensis]
MESFSVLQFLKDKTILVTGATGFLAKIFVEKILRIQPNLKKLYLLIRARDDKSAKQRMFREVIEKDLFRVLRDTWGDSLDSFILEKVAAVPGDISYEDLGIKDSNLKEEMCRQIDLVVNVAAITKFDERYDALLDTNTMGAFHVLSFAKNCTKMQMLVHLSSAYACGEKSGLIPENSFTMGEMLKWPRQLDIMAEKKLVEQKLNQLQTTGAAEDEVTSIMKDLGMERTIDSPLIAYGKGKIDCLPVNSQTIFDLIPADMVVNSMIMAMVANANNPSSQMIYHVGSSLRNPIQFFQIHEFVFHYFTKNPYIDKYGNPVIVGKFKVLDSPAKFHKYMAVRSVLPLKGIFDDTNSEKLRRAMRESGVELDSFNFDPKSIDWEDYFLNVHIPGLLRYVVK